MNVIPDHLNVKAAYYRDLMIIKMVFRILAHAESPHEKNTPIHRHLSNAICILLSKQSAERAS